MTPDDLVLTPQGIRFRGRVLACSIGKRGVTATKREGDGCSPVGIHRISRLFYRADRLAKPAAWAQMIGHMDIWCDDPGHAEYNHHTQAPLGASHERLRRADPLYDLILTTNWNLPIAVPGQGSAIFLHQWRRPGYGTEGCIAFSRRDLLWICRQVRAGTRLIVPNRQ